MAEECKISTGGEEAVDAISCDSDQKVMEERALSVFSSEKHEDLTALIFCLITTFVVLLFTKWI